MMTDIHLRHVETDEALALAGYRLQESLIDLERHFAERYGAIDVQL